MCSSTAGIKMLGWKYVVQNPPSSSIIRRKRLMEDGVEGWLVGMAMSRVRMISSGEMIRCVRRWLATEMESPIPG